MMGHFLLTMMRRGLPALAVYALLLQAFLVGAAPAPAFDPTPPPNLPRLLYKSYPPAEKRGVESWGAARQ